MGDHSQGGGPVNMRSFSLLVLLMAIALVLGEENFEKKQDENEGGGEDGGEGELPKQGRGKRREIERVETKPIRRQRPEPKNTSSRNNNGVRKPTPRRDPRRRELQNRAKKERKDLMKCGEDSKSAECMKHVLKKYDK